MIEKKENSNGFAKHFKIFKEPEISHFTKEEALTKGRGFYHNGAEYVHHADLPHHESAFYRLSSEQKLFLTVLVVVLAVGVFFAWRQTFTILIAVLTLIYFSDLIFNLFLIIRSFAKPPELQITKEEIDALDESTLPAYTVFCPLYKESNVLPQFVKAMNDLDYPKEKLQVMLLLEQDDPETISVARNSNLPANFDIVVIPHSAPKTKPKALNFGLIHAKGELITIYDAEDVPEVDQLKKAVIAFNTSDPRVRCIQAKLNFYNPHQNILTRAFTAEYSLWFDLVLTGLQSLQAPIPLGGTSNHFRKRDLIDLKGWDAFNVTEDCDLGMRLVKRGYRTAIIDSTTYEEANSSMSNWFWQRTRWIKGYIQTYLVHMRRPHEFINHWREPHVITFQLVVGGKIASMIINPIMWILTISYFLFRSTLGPSIESLFPAPVFYMAIFSLVLGNFLYLYYYMLGCAKRKEYKIIKYIIFVPLYWLAISLAAYTSWYKLIVQPHYWAKTKHGLHLKNVPVAPEEKIEIEKEKILDTVLQDLEIEHQRFDFKKDEAQKEEMNFGFKSF